MTKKRITHIITSLKIGGAETLLVRLVSSLSIYEYTVLYFHDGPRRLELERAGIRCIRIRGFVPYDPLFLVRLIYYIVRSQADCIHTWLWSANVLGSLIGRLLRIPVILSIHSVYNKTGVARNSRFKNIGDALALRCANSILFVSTMTKQLYEAYHQVSEHKTVIIPNGVPVPVVQQHTQPSTEFIVGTVGRFIPLKNHALLIDCIESLRMMFPHIRLILIGYGPLEDALRARVHAKKLTDAVTFIKTDDPAPYYQHMNCFILPSEQEGLSVALLEAMAHGLPVIVTSPTASHDVVQAYKTGLVVKPCKEELVRALTWMVQHHEERAACGIQARNLIQAEYSHDVMLQAYKAMYETI